MPISCVVQLTPTTPTPLPPVAPIVPETWVPWLWSSIGSHVSVMALNPWDPAGHVTVAPPIVDREGRRRRPDVRGEIRMRVVDAGVDDRDDLRRRTERHVPRLRCVNVGARDAGRLR